MKSKANVEESEVAEESGSENLAPRSLKQGRLDLRIREPLIWFRKPSLAETAPVQCAHLKNEPGGAHPIAFHGLETVPHLLQTASSSGAASSKASWGQRSLPKIHENRLHERTHPRLVNGFSREFGTGSKAHDAQREQLAMEILTIPKRLGRGPCTPEKPQFKRRKNSGNGQAPQFRARG